jgi:hypothetical protein
MPCLTRRSFLATLGTGLAVAPGLLGAQSRPARYPISFSTLGTWIRHTHLKDSKPGGADRRYTLLGAGEVPVAEQVTVLAAGGYQGYYGFEWEKKWQPEIEEPEVAFPHYAKTMAAYLAEAGVKAG